MKPAITTVRPSCTPSLQGFVYLKFQTVQAAQAAQQSLHGRYFSSRQISAEFQFEPMYNNYFQIQ